MDFPIVEFPWFGNGNIVALIAIIHVLISHGVAIGATAIVVSTEYYAMQTKNAKLDQLAKQLTKWIVIITTTVGAMTGVGIWLSTMVIQPDSIGSLLRIFFWAWVTEWVIFIGEVVLLLIYYYTWEKWKKGKEKQKHLNIGITLAVFSWLTMAIITGILAAKLTPGRWVETLSFWNAFFNPTYLPSLAFRTFLAVTLAISLFTIFVRLFVKDKDVRLPLFRIFSIWGAISLPATFIFGIWYLKSIPEQAAKLIVWSTGLPEQTFNVLNLIAFALIVVFLIWLVIRPKKLPAVLALAMFISAIGFIGEFEVVRESIRKPYIIYNYMYVNGITAAKAEAMNRDGYLAHSTIAKVKTITEENKIEAGREIYEGQCLACHTIDGWRSKRALANRLQGWPQKSIEAFIPSMHQVRPMMPPFVGTKEEVEALAAYLYKVVNEQN
ncbi:cytochrome C [Anoxybacillus flavithermus]|uniref:Cytochrome C n=1 Tax=Anoxybacillus flavithermus TaxID=33934 RepID=A0A2G5RRE0_9BACL|nr:cytochrome C [Anoxybacillus sp. KU2-6(11)]PIC05249.1 cytochrome C [Anoxybacillus flavithermus]